MKKLLSILLAIFIAFTVMPSDVFAEERFEYVNGEYFSSSGYRALLKEKETIGEDLPLPKLTSNRKLWTDSTKKILENKNREIIEIEETRISTTFVFKPLSLEEAMALSLEGKGFIEKVTYITTSNGYESRIEDWINVGGVYELDTCSATNYNNASSVLLTVLSFSSNPYVSTTATLLSIIQTVSNFNDKPINRNGRYYADTSVLRAYKTRNAYAYGITWVLGAQVQREEEYKYLKLHEIDGTYVDTTDYNNDPNSSYSNYDSYREKPRYNDIDWLLNRAEEVAWGQNTQYIDVYRVVVPE